MFKCNTILKQGSYYIIPPAVILTNSTCCSQTVRVFASFVWFSQRADIVSMHSIHRSVLHNLDVFHNFGNGLSNIKIMHPVVFNYKIRCKQITIEHNFMKYSYSYMVRPRGVIIRLIYRTIQRITHVALHL